MRRTNYAAIIFALIVSVSVGGASADDSFKVGFSLPLSGSNADVGTAARNGIELARLSQPEQFRAISFLYSDNQYDAKTAISDFHKFAEKDDVKLIYIWGSPTCMAVAPIAEAAHLPLACLSGDPKPGLKYVFSFNSMATDYAAVALADINTKQPKRIAIVYATVPFLTNVAHEVVHVLKQNGKEPLEIAVNPGATDLRAEVLKLKSFAPDYLILFNLPPQLISIAREMSLFKFKPSIFGADTFADSQVTEASNGYFSGASYVDMIIPDEFRKQYQAKFGNTSNLSFAYNTYRFSLMVADLFGDQHDGEEATVAEKLRSSNKSADAALGPITFQESESNGQYFRFPITSIPAP